MAVADPTRADVFQVENSDAPAGPRRLEARVSDGSLLFRDPQVPDGIALFELAGLQRAHNTIVVSQTGEAASKDLDDQPITTIQQALDRVPDSADQNNPWLILVMPGVYDENILWTKDWVFLVGVGPVVLRSPLDQDTVRVVQGESTIPRRLRIQNIRIESSSIGRSCVHFLTSRFAVGSVTFSANPNAGDILTIGGVSFMAVQNGTTPAANQFELGLDIPTTIANLIDSIRDPINGITDQVVPSSSGNTLILRAYEPGVSGNSIALTSLVPLVMIPSGATFSGGAEESADSQVALELAELFDCDLVATGMNGRPVRAKGVNRIKVKGGDWSDSAEGISIFDVREVAYLDVQDVLLQRVEVHYNSASDYKPLTPTSSYSFRNVQVRGGFSSNLAGNGSLDCSLCSLQSVSVSGSQSFKFARSDMGNLLVGGHSKVTLSSCKRGSANGEITAHLDETSMRGSLEFNNSAEETFTFPIPSSSPDYQVHVEVSSEDVPFIPSGLKGNEGFAIRFSNAVTQAVRFEVRRNI